jgi:hypothetical protein
MVPGHKLRCDASIMFDLMSVDFSEEFGRPLRLTDSYRDYATQVSVKARNTGLAATPGTSNHGWGLANSKKAKRSSKVEEASSQAKAKAETEPGERAKVAEVK